ncbi:MAG: cytochrome c biogenesis protein ResB [Deltaproteobacteria bacterium]|nr:cytochrome c biogenesis protein ResB [Deltaproteobacteria bacterium]
MKDKAGPWASVNAAFSSIKLTLFIFFFLALASIIGTLLPQGLALEEMRKHFSPGVFWWIETLSLHDLYHAAWFQFLLLVLALNLVVCSLDRFPRTMKLLSHREEGLSADKLTKFTHHRAYATSLSMEEVVSRLDEFISAQFAKLQPLESPPKFSAIAEKGGWSRLMVYVVHLSVLLILAGALIGSLYGFRGFMQIAEGQASNEVQLAQSRRVLVLPFEVRCDNFEVSFYDTGMPREFRSDLSILKEGLEALRQPVYVNDPLTYEGVTFYQATYGGVLKEIELELTDKESGRIQRITLPFRETSTIPGTEDRIQVVEYQKEFSNFGPAAGIVVLKKGQEPTGSWILIDRPDFHGNRIGGYQVKVLKAESGYYTGLQVKRDPGVWVVYIGFVALLVGIGLCFYTSHRKLWVLAEPDSGGHGETRVIVAGRTSKNGVAFEREFQDLCDRLGGVLIVK